MPRSQNYKILSLLLKSITLQYSDSGSVVVHTSSNHAACLFPKVCACMRAYIRACVCMSIVVYMCVEMCLCVYVYNMHMPTCMCVYDCMCVEGAYMCMCVHMYIHMCV